MRQVLMQRGSHSFIRYCAGESVFAGLRRIAKLATSIAIAVAFSGIALPTSSAQAQSATFAVGETTFAENETSSVTLTLDNLPTDQDISSAEVELIFTDAGFGTPSGTTYTGTSFAVTVTGDNTITPMPVAQPTRIRVAAAISPGDTTADITWTIQPADISSNVTFTARRPGGKHIIFKDSNGNPVTVAGLRQPALRQAFTITTVLAEDAVFVTYTYQNGDTIPGVKREEPTNTSEVGVDWNPAVGINLLAGQTARYSDGTAYECDSSSSSNCLIRIPGGQIANGGPVNATFPEESAPPAPTIPTPPPPVAEPGPELEIGKQVIPGTETAVVFNDTGVPGFPGEEGSRSRSIAETSAIVQAFNQSFDDDDATFTTAKCTYGLGGDALYGVDYYVLNSSDADILHPDDPLLVGTPTLRVVFNGPVDPNDPNDEGNPVADDSDNFLLIDERCTPASPVTWSIRLIGDNVVQGNKRIVFALREVQLFAGGTAPENALGVLAITQPDTLVLTVVDDEVNDVGQVVVNEITDGGASTPEGSTASHRIGLDRGNDGIVFMAYAITGINEEGNVVTDASTGISAADITAVTAMNAAIGSAVAATRDGVVAHDVSDDIRRGVIAIVANPAGAQSLEGILNINFADDSTPEGDETYALTLSSLDNSVIFVNSLRPGLRPGTNEQEVTEPGVGRIQAIITDDDDAPTTVISNFFGPSLNEGGTLNFTFTLTDYTLSTDLHYRIAGIARTGLAESDPVRPAAGSLTTVSASADPRSGTFQVTARTTPLGGGPDIIQGSILLTARTDNILEEAEEFTFTVLAGDPDNSNLALSGGTHTITLNDATPAIIPTLTWPGRTNSDPEDRDRGTRCEDNHMTACDETLLVGSRVFPGGVLEGATPHLLVDLGTTVVARDTVVPIVVGGAFVEDAQVEPLYFKPVPPDAPSGTEPVAVRGALIPAGSSRGTARVQILVDQMADEGDTITFTMGTPEDLVNPAFTDIAAKIDTSPPRLAASIAVRDRPAVEENAVTWTEVTGQVNPGAGETHVANLTIRVDGGFTSDREAVDIRFSTGTTDLSMLGEISWKRQGSDNVLPVITGDHIAVSRFSFSPASASDSTPTVTIRLFFTPKAEIDAGEQVTVNLTSVNVINRSAGFGRAPIRAILCNDNDDVPDKDGCRNQGFSAGDPKYLITELREFADEDGPVNGGFKLAIAATSRTPVGTTTAGTINYSVGGTALRGITRDYTLEITATNATGNTPTTDDLTTTTFGRVSIPAANLDNIISFTVRPVADAINERTETVVITISGIEFTGGTLAPITDSRRLTVNIANAPVPVMQLSSSDTFLLLAGAENPDAPVRTGRNNDDIRGDDQRFNIPSVRLRVTPAPGAVFPEEAFYATIAYTVDPDSTATFGVGEDYTIARETTLASEPTPVGGLGTSSSFTLSRDSTDAGPQIDRSTGISNLDFWLNINDDSTLEPPETVIMNFTTTLFACASGLNGANTACTGGQAETPLGLPIPFTLSFLINDNDGVAITGVRTTPPVVNEDARNSADRRVLVALLGNFDSHIVINRDVEIDYNITDASGGAITDNTLGVTAADFTIPDQIRNNRGASDCTTARLSQDERDAGVIICRGTITAIGNTNQHIEIDIVDDDDGENEEAFYVNFEAKTVATGAGEREIAAGTRALVTIAASDGGGPPPIVENRGSITTTGPVNLVRRDTTRTAVTFSATGLPLDPDGGASATRAIFQAQITAADGNTWVAAEDFILQDASAGGNEVTINTSGEFESGRLTVSAAGAATFTVYLDPSAGTQTGNESFRITLTAVKACKVDSGGACMGADLEPAVTIVGSPLVVNLGVPPTVSVAATNSPAVEGSALGLVTFTLSEVPTADTTITFTATGDNRGSCTVVSNTGFCGDAPSPAGANYVLATRTGTEESYAYTIIPTATTTITIPANTDPPTYVMAIIPTSEDDSAADADETAVITVTDADNGYIPAASPNNAATVNIIDPGSATLERTVPADTVLTIGGEAGYQVTLANVGVPDNTNNNAPIRNRGIGSELIDAVFELTFPAGQNFDDVPNSLTFGTVITGDDFNVAFNSTNLSGLTVTRPASNVLRVVVPQLQLVQTGPSGGSVAGAEETDFTVSANAATSSPLVIGLDAYTTEAGTTTRLDELVLFGTNALEVIGRPTASLSRSNSLTGNIPTDALADALTLSFTNPFSEEEGGIADAEITYTLRITPTDAASLADGVDPAFNNHFQIMASGAINPVSIFTTPSDDDTAREFTVSRSNVDLGVGEATTLGVSLQALPFTRGDRSFTIALVNVAAVDMNSVRRVDTRPTNADPANLRTTVSVAETTDPVARLRVTGPLVIGLVTDLTNTTTFEVELINIPTEDEAVSPEAVTMVDVTLNFNGSTIREVGGGANDYDDDFDPVQDTSNSAETDQFRVSAVTPAVLQTIVGIETLIFRADTTNFRNGAPFLFSLANVGGDSGEIHVTVSAVVYLDAAATASTFREATILDIPLLAQRTITVEDDNTVLAAVSIADEVADSDHVLSEGGPADFTVDLTAIPTAVSRQTATFVDVELSADTAAGSLRFNRALSNGSITMGGASEFTLSPPEGETMFINTSDNSETAVLRMPISTGDETATITVAAGSNLTMADPFISLSPTGISWRTDDGALPGGPVVHRVGKQQFLVDTVSPATARIETDNPVIMRGTDGEFTVTLEGFNLIDANGNDIDEALIQLNLTDSGGSNIATTAPAGDTRTFTTADNLSFTYNNIPGATARSGGGGNSMRITIPRARFVAAPADNDEAQGYERVTFAVAASNVATPGVTPPGDYNLELEGATSYSVLDPDAITFSVVAPLAATLARLDPLGGLVDNVVEGGGADATKKVADFEITGIPLRAARPSTTGAMRAVVTLSGTLNTEDDGSLTDLRWAFIDSGTPDDSDYRTTTTAEICIALDANTTTINRDIWFDRISDDVWQSSEQVILTVNSVSWLESADCDSNPNADEPVLVPTGTASVDVHDDGDLIADGFVVDIGAPPADVSEASSSPIIIPIDYGTPPTMIGAGQDITPTHTSMTIEFSGDAVLGPVGGTATTVDYTAQIFLGGTRVLDIVPGQREYGFSMPLSSQNLQIRIFPQNTTGGNAENMGEDITIMISEIYLYDTDVDAAAVAGSAASIEDGSVTFFLQDDPVAAPSIAGNAATLQGSSGSVQIRLSPTFVPGTDRAVDNGTLRGIAADPDMGIAEDPGATVVLNGGGEITHFIFVGNGEDEDGTNGMQVIEDCSSGTRDFVPDFAIAIGDLDGCDATRVDGGSDAGLVLGGYAGQSMRFKLRNSARIESEVITLTLSLPGPAPTVSLINPAVVQAAIVTAIRSLVPPSDAPPAVGATEVRVRDINRVTSIAVEGMTQDVADTFNSDSFSGLGALETLDLSHASNTFETLPSGAIANVLVTLRNLSMPSSFQKTVVGFSPASVSIGPENTTRISVQLRNEANTATAESPVVIIPTLIHSRNLSLLRAKTGGGIDRSNLSPRLRAGDDSSVEYVATHTGDTDGTVTVASVEIQNAAGRSGAVRNAHDGVVSALVEIGSGNGITGASGTVTLDADATPDRTPRISLAPATGSQTTIPDGGTTTLDLTLANMPSCRSAGEGNIYLTGDDCTDAGGSLLTGFDVSLLFPDGTFPSGSAPFTGDVDGDGTNDITVDFGSSFTARRIHAGRLSVRIEDGDLDAGRGITIPIAVRAEEQTSGEFNIYLTNEEVDEKPLASGEEPRRYVSGRRDDVYLTFSGLRPTVAVTRGANTIREAGGTRATNYTLAFTNVPATDTVFTYNFDGPDSTATAGEDYTIAATATGGIAGPTLDENAASGTFTLPGNTTTNDGDRIILTITAEDDNIIEDDEVITLLLETENFLFNVTFSSTIVTIANTGDANDDTLALTTGTFEVPANVTEGETYPFTLQIVDNKVFATDATFDITFVAGTAEAEDVTLDTEVVIPAGQSKGSANVMIVSGDADISGTTSETFQIQAALPTVPELGTIRITSIFPFSTADITINAEASLGLCAGRTEEVSTAILAAISALEAYSSQDCEMSATDQAAKLSAVRTLNLGSQSLTLLQPGDFAGLDGLSSLDISNNTSLTSLPNGIMDPILPTLTSLDTGTTTTTTPIKRFLTFSTPSAYTVTQGGEPVTITLSVTNAAGEPAAAPVAAFVPLTGLTTGLTNANAANSVGGVIGVIIPAGSTSVDVALSATDVAVTGSATLEFGTVSLGTAASTPTSFIAITQTGGTADQRTAVISNLFEADSSSSATVNVRSPASLAPDTAFAAELNNAPADITLTLPPAGSNDHDVVDVTFTLAGSATFATDYLLTVTHPDGVAVKAENSPNGRTGEDFVSGAGGGTFRLPASVGEAVFTVTPIADNDSDNNETVNITVTNVVFTDLDPDPVTPPTEITTDSNLAVVTITDAAQPTIMVEASSGVGGDEQITEGSAGDNQGTFTITIADGPTAPHLATVSYDLDVSGQADTLAFSEDTSAIFGISTDGLGDVDPTASGPGTFMMTAAVGTLRFAARAGDETPAGEPDMDSETVTLTINSVTFSDIGDGTNITASASDVITINDSNPITNICSRSERVIAAILGDSGVSATMCEDVQNDAPVLARITELDVTTLPATDGLKASDFAGLTGMTELSLGGVFTSLPTGLFNEPTGQTSLTNLTIDGALTGLTANVFDTLTALRDLDLSGNNLMTVNGTVFDRLTSLEDLNLSGSTSLDITAGTLDTVLSRLDDLTWPTTRTARFPAGTSIIVEQDGTANVPVQLNAPLPVAVSIPVIVSSATTGVTATAAAVIPAGQIGPEDAVITAVSATETTTGRITIGVPVLQTTPATGNSVNINPTPADSVRDALVTRDRTAASLNVIAPTGPTARLVGPGRSLGLGGTANFSVVLSNIDDIMDTAFTHVEVAVELGGAGIAGDLDLVPSDVDSVETSDYRIDITSGNVVTADGDTAVDTEEMGGSPAALYVYVPRGEFDALDGGSGDAAGAETINFTLTIKDDAGFSLTTTPNTLMPSLRFANGNSTVRAVNASLGDVINGDITVIGTDLTYTIVEPLRVAPVTASIDEESRDQPITLTLTSPASGTVTIPYTLGGTAATDSTDYTIIPTGDSTAMAFVIPDGESTATITVRTVPDRVDDGDKMVIITLAGGTYPGVGTLNGEIVSTITITNDDDTPTGVTVTANPVQINETGNTTQSIITVRLDQPALADLAVSLMYTIIGTATLSTDGTCSADNNADYTAAIVGGTTITSATPEMPGTLTFAAGTVGMVGDREKRITVTACEDEEDESDDPDETVTFTIRAADAMNLTLTADVSTTITIREITVIPQDVMDQVETVATVVATEHVSALTTLIRQRFSVTSSFGSPPRVPTGTVPAPSTTTNLALADNPENMNDMINSMGLERTAQGDSNNQYAVWIRGQRSVFEGTPEIRGLTVDYDGTSTGIGMGAEYSSGGYLAGLAMNYVTTEVDISSDSEGETISKYEESIVIAAPYFSLKAGDGTSLWASFGVGSGTADAKLATQTKSADVSLTFLNAGADFTVIGRSFEVVTGLSGLAIRKVVDSFTFTDPEHVLPKTTIDTMQAVGEVTIYRPIPIAGQIVRPYMGISTIHDFGDIVADDDHGLGIRSGVTFGAGRISADIELSSELLRENRRQWTVSGGARFATRSGGQGLSLSLDGTQETQMDTEESVGDDAARTWGVGLEGGYGMPMGLLHPNGLLTPFASIDQTGDGRDMSGGARFSVGNGLSLDLETTRQMHDDSEDASEHKAGLRGQWSF